jgi:integrase
MEAKKATLQRSRVRVERGIYRQPNGKYAVCFMLAGKPRFRTVAGDLGAARRERAALAAAAAAGNLAVSPRLRFATVVDRWLERFEAKVAAGERRERTLEAHRYHVKKHLLPTLAPRVMRTISVEDVAQLLTGLRARGRSEKTAAEALATLNSIVRFALRNGWIADNPVSKLEADERPHPTRRRQRVLGRDEIRRLLTACPPRYRPLLATALYSGLRISELLGLVWDDVDLGADVIHVRAQLSRAHREAPARRVAPKTPAAMRDVPLVAQLADTLREHRRGSVFSAGSDWVFATGRGTPLGHRNVERRGLQRGPDCRARRRRVAAVALPRPAAHLRQPPDPRPWAGPGAGQPHPRPRARDDHARRLHPPLRRGPPRRRDPHPDGPERVCAPAGSGQLGLRRRPAACCLARRPRHLTSLTRRRAGPRS